MTEAVAPVQRKAEGTAGGADGARAVAAAQGEGGARHTIGSLFGAPGADGGGGAGAALPGALRHTMEAAFATDFSTVRVHEGGAAPAMGALAYTQGEDIHFAPGRWDPESAKGKELLSHELTHVVQNRSGGGGTREVSSPGDPAEKEAEQLAPQAAAGSRVSVSASPSAGIQRVKGLSKGQAVTVRVTEESDVESAFYDAVIEEVLEDGARYTVKFSDLMVDALVKNKTFDEKVVGPKKQVVKETFVAPTNKSKAMESILEVAGNRGVDVSQDKPKQSTGLELSFEEQQRLAAMRKYMETKGPWNNCGNTARNLILSLQSCGGEFVRALNVEIGVEELQVLRSLLESDVAEVTLIDIAIFGVHEFTIEKHPGGRMTLSQGYQGLYSAFWFAGLDDQELFQQPKDGSLLEARQNAGGGQQIPEDFNDNLVGFLKNGSWDAKGVGEAWKKLPMHPKESLPKTDKIRLKIEVWTCKNAKQLFESLDGDPKKDFLCQLVLKKELKSLEALRKEAGAIGLKEQETLGSKDSSTESPKESSGGTSGGKVAQVEQEEGARARYSVWDTVEGSAAELAELLGVSVEYARQRLNPQRKGYVFTMANICWGVDSYWLRGENFESVYKLTRLPDNSYI